MQESKIMTGKLIDKDSDGQWGKVQPSMGAWATFRADDMLGKLTIAELKVGDELMFQESSRIPGMRSRYVTNVWRKKDV